MECCFSPFVIGARFDFRTTSIMLVPLALVAIMPGIDIARHPIVRRMHYLVTVVLAAIVFFFHLVDIEFFRFFPHPSQRLGAALGRQPR